MEISLLICDNITDGRFTHKDISAMIQLLPVELLRKSRICNNILSILPYNRESGVSQILVDLINKDVFPLKTLHDNFITTFFKLHIIKDKMVKLKIINNIRTNYDVNFLESCFMSLDEMMDKKIFLDINLVQPKDTILDLIGANTSNRYKKILYNEIINVKEGFIDVDLFIVLKNLKALRMKPELIESFLYYYKKLPCIMIDGYYNGSFPFDDNVLELCSLLKKHYSDQKIINLLIKYMTSPDDSFIKDSLYMVKKFNNEEKFPKCRSFLDLHDTLNLISQKRSKKLIQLPAQVELCEEIKKNDLELRNQLDQYGLDYTIPLTNHDLINLGFALSICIGNDNYIEESLNNTSAYMVLNNKLSNKPIYCISFTLNPKGSYCNMAPGIIREARGFRNEKIPDQYFTIVQAFLKDIYS